MTATPPSTTPDARPQRTLDVGAVRAQVPALASGTAFFDGPGGTQTPRPVIDAMAAALAAPLSNRGRNTPAERHAEDLVSGAREAMADLLGAEPGGVVLGRSATQLAYDFSRTLAATWRPGDEIVVTSLDHDSNIRPWLQAAERAGVTVRWAEFEPSSGELSPEAVGAVISGRTRLVAVTGASNLIGTRPDLPALAALAHAVGALLWVDGVHLSAHSGVDLRATGADFLVCSPYKFLGPHTGVLAARPDLLETLRPDKLSTSSDAVPERFEYGTLPYEQLAGMRAAVDFLASLGGNSGGRDGGGRRARLETAFARITAHEDALRTRIEAALAELPGVRCHARAAVRTPTLLLTFDGRPAADATAHLAARGVNAPTGSFYAREASRRLGLGDGGGLRVGLACYNSDDDVDRLLAGLRSFTAGG